MKLTELLTEGMTLNIPRLTQCVAQFVLSNKQRWKGFGSMNPDTMFGHGLCGMWAYFAKRVDPSLDVQETQDHAWVKDPTTKMLYDAQTPEGTKFKKRLRGFDGDRPGETEIAGATRWGEVISTGNFQYEVSEDEEQSIIDCYHGKPHSGAVA